MTSRRLHTRTSLAGLTATAVASALFSTAAHADEKPQPFVLAAYVNGLGGESVMMGQYDAAIEEINASRRKMSQDALAAATNLCVAYSMKRQWENARQACDAAVFRAKTEIRSQPTSMRMGRHSYRSQLALAYSNRAVMYWLARDATRAADDLEKAEALSPQADFVAQNRSAFAAKTAALAQVAGSPRS